MGSPTQFRDEAKPLVIVVDDDKSARDALEGLFRSVGLDVVLFSAAADLLLFRLPDRPGCIILDVRLPGTSGLEVHRMLLAKGYTLPVIFITGHGDIPMSVKAMKDGAVDFFCKPFRDQDLIDAVHLAISTDKERHRSLADVSELRGLFEALRLREREVLEHVAAGLLNKQIAGVMGLSENTIKVHRSSVMRKMKARSLASLLQSVQRLKPVHQAQGF